MLINRGWVPRGLDRNVLPELPVPDGMVTIHGMIAKPAAKPPFAFSDLNREGEGWPAVVQWIEIDSLATALGYVMQPIEIRLAADAPNGFVRDWAGHDLMPEKNIGYAMQWFGFAIVLLIIYVVLTFRRKIIE